MSGLYSNSKSVTERLIDALVYGLKQITTENGYDNTVKDIFLEIPSQSQIVNYPCISLIQGRETTDWDDTNDMVHTLPIKLMVFCNNQDNATTSRLTLKKDLHRHFGLNWMVRGEDGVETCRIIRPSAYEPFGMFLNAPKIGFIMELIAVYNQDVDDPTVAT